MRLCGHGLVCQICEMPGCPAHTSRAHLHDPIPIPSPSPRPRPRPGPQNLLGSAHLPPAARKPAPLRGTTWLAMNRQMDKSMNGIIIDSLNNLLAAILLHEPRTLLRTSDKAHSRVICHGRLARSLARSPCSALPCGTRRLAKTKPSSRRPAGQVKPTAVKLLCNITQGLAIRRRMCSRNFRQTSSRERRTPRDHTLCPNFNGLNPSLTRSGKRVGETTRDKTALPPPPHPIQRDPGSRATEGNQGTKYPSIPGAAWHGAARCQKQDHVCSAQRERLPPTEDHHQRRTRYRD